MVVTAQWTPSPVVEATKETVDPVDLARIKSEYTALALWIRDSASEGTVLSVLGFQTNQIPAGHDPTDMSVLNWTNAGMYVASI